MWECVDGSVVKGEDSLQGAVRETKEEVGVDLLPEKGHVILSDIKKIEFGKVVNKIVDVWLFEYDGEVDLSNATTDEVEQVAWMSRSQIKELFDANIRSLYFSILVKMCIRDRYQKRIERKKYFQ